MDPLALVLEVIGPFKYVLGGLIVLGLGAFVVAAIFGKSDDTKSESKEKRLYEYRAKQSIMTAAEQQFFNALGAAVGQEFRIFAQVRLSALVDHEVKNGQYWKAALGHINQKSVDFVLADKETLATRLAIELDDRSHEREDRKERDGEVERVLKAAGIPVLRVPNAGQFEPSAIQSQIRTAIGK